MKAFRKIIFSVSVIAALYFCLRGFGKNIILPFPAGITPDSPVSFHFEENKESAVIDRNDSRIIFLNKERQAQNILMLGSDSLLTKAYDVTRDETYFYVLGVKYQRNTGFVNTVRIVRYDLNGENGQVLFETKTDDLSFFNDRQGIWSYGDRLISIRGMKSPGTEGVCCYYTIPKDQSNGSEAVMHPLEEIPSVFSFDFSENDGFLHVIDYTGQAYEVNGETVTPVSLTNSRRPDMLVSLGGGSFAVTDIWDNSIYRDGNRLANDIGAYKLFYNGTRIYANCYEANDRICAIDPVNGACTFYDFFPYSAGLEILAVVQLISRAYLIVLAAFATVSAVKKFIKENGKERLKFYSTMGIIAAGTVFVAVFYSGSLYNQSVSDMKEAVVMENRLIGQSLSSFLKENYPDFGRETSLEKASDNAGFHQDDYNRFFGSYIDIYKKQNRDVYIIVTEKCGENYISSYESSCTTFPGTLTDPTNVEPYLKYSDEAQHFRALGASQIYNIQSVIDENGNLLGTISLSRDSNVLNQQAFSRCLELTMTLLTILIAVYIIMTELGALISAGRKLRSDHEGRRRPVLTCFQTVVFIFSLISDVDSVLMVLIAKEMLDASGIVSVAGTLLLGLPALAKGAGGTIGANLYTFLGGKLDDKKSNCIFSLVMLGSALGMAFSVVSASYILFCLFKFTLQTSNSYLYTMITTLPAETDDEEERYEAFEKSSKGDISSGILGVMLGGLIAEKFGNAAVYFVISGICLIWILFSIRLITKNTTENKNTEKAVCPQDRKAYLRLMLSPSVLAYILLISMPVIVGSGYKNYLFPLLSAEMAIPKLYITNICVIAKGAANMFMGPVSGLMKKTDYWVRLVLGIPVMGICYLCFVINDTIAWAVIVLVISQVITKLITPAKDTVWLREAEGRGLDPKAASRLMAPVSQTAASLKESALTVFLLAGSVGAAVLLGAWCFAGPLLFALITRNSYMNKEKNINET